MRVSTAYLAQKGLNSLLGQQNQLADVQERIATNQRILRPSDDPTGMAQILRLNEAVSVTDQYQRNADNAANRLTLEESTLNNVQESLLRVRDLALQGNNSTLNNQDRASLAVEVRERLNELVSLANTRDANQDYLFSGYKVTTKPFSQAADGTFVYSGDQGQRSLQISSGRNIVDADSGHDVFVDTKNGNGTFQINMKTSNTVYPGAYTAAVSDGTAAVQNDATASGAFTTVNLGAAETYSLTVGGISVYTETDGGGGTDTVTAAEVDAGLTAATVALNGAGITFTGTVAGNDLVFSRVDGAAFNIDVVNDPGANGFAGLDFATGTNTINNGSVAVAPTDTAFTMSIDGTQFFTEAAAIGGTVTAAELDASLTAFVAGSGGAYSIDSGSIAAGDLVLSKADGTTVTLTIDSNFSGTVGAFSGPLVSAFNAGSGVFDIGTLVDATAYVNDTYTISYVTNANGNLAYNVVGAATGQLIPPLPQNLVSDAPDHLSGTSIQFNGIQTAVSGTPVAGDVYTITPSNKQDVFSAVQKLALAFEGGALGQAGESATFNLINQAISEIDISFEKVSSIRAGIGARLKAIEDQTSVNSAFKLEMEAILSSVKDLDIVSAVIELQTRSTSLEAAQASFSRIQGLSLFNFL